MIGKTQGSAKVVALNQTDPIFARMTDEAQEVIRREPEIAGFIYAAVLNHESSKASSCIVSRRAWPTRMCRAI